MWRWVTRRDLSWGQEEQGFKSFLSADVRMLRVHSLRHASSGLSNQDFSQFGRGDVTWLANTTYPFCTIRVHVSTLSLWHWDHSRHDLESRCVSSGESISMRFFRGVAAFLSFIRAPINRGLVT